MAQEERTVTVTSADRIAIVQALKAYLNNIEYENEDGAQQDIDHVETLIRKFND
jgi:hypothetical protein